MEKKTARLFDRWQCTIAERKWREISNFSSFSLFFFFSLSNCSLYIYYIDFAAFLYAAVMQ